MEIAPLCSRTVEIFALWLHCMTKKVAVGVIHFHDHLVHSRVEFLWQCDVLDELVGQKDSQCKTCLWTSIDVNLFKAPNTN